MKKIHNKRANGFSIVELLMYMGLVTILIAILTSIFLAALEAQLSSQASSSSLTSGRYILSRLQYDIHRADSIIVPSDFGTNTSNLILEIDGTNHSYSLVDGNLVLGIGGNMDSLNETQTTISNLSFTKIGNVGGKPTVTINFTVTGTESQPPEVRNFETVIGTR